MASLLVAALAAGAAFAQGAAGAVAARLDGAWTLVALDDLARALGAAWSDDGRALTLRAPTGVLTAFLGEADALWLPTGGGEPTIVAAALPVQRHEGRWYVPEDLIGVLGVRVDGAYLRLPDGDARTLVVARVASVGGLAEVVALGPGVEGLRLFADGAGGPGSVSLLAVDLGLLALALPEQREALDAVLRDLRAEKALFLAVTALAATPWDGALYVAQDGREVLLSAPFSVQVLEGDPERVAPDAPLAAVAFLPADFDLRRPLALRWAGASGSWTLRR